MRASRRILGSLALFLGALQAAPSLGVRPASAQPALEGQKAWGEREKKEFLEFLRSGQKAPAPGGTVKASALAAGPAVRRSARYLTVAVVTDALFTEGNGQEPRSEGLGLGLRALYGRHLFSWVRAYGGLQVTPLRQRRLDDSVVKLAHWKVPVGLELALVPLGTPHTRYFVLRGGLAAHHVAGPASESEFRAPALGTRLAWDLGLGYEWQFHDSPLRLTLAADGYRSLARDRGASFFGGSFNAGLTWTF